MSQAQVREIPGTLDEPPLVLIWSADEIAPFLLFVCLGMIIDQIIPAIAVGWLISYAYRKHRDRKPDGFVFHLLYTYGMPVVRERRFPNPFAKKWRP